jgi:riboflavin synthase alpha subunit
VEGEKRYWLHIALGGDLVSGHVDVLGSQLEEVVE